MKTNYFLRCLASFGCILPLFAAPCMAQSTAAPATPSLVKNGGMSAADIPESKTEIEQNRAPEHIFRKKILATAFAVNRLAQVADIDNIAQNFPRELLLRLENSRKFLTRNSPDLLSYTRQQETPSVKLIKQVAAEYDSQFVIAGEIRNAGLDIEKKYFGLWENRKRHIDIEFAIYDGLSGALLARHNVRRQTEEQTSVGRDKPFGSAVFFATSYGKVLDSLLEESAQLIEQDLAPFPLLAKILKVSNGQVVLDAGATSAIAKGDLASVEAANHELPTQGLRSHQSLPAMYGVAQTNVGKLTIIQVQYLFSVGELSAQIKPDQLHVGDYVRFDTVMEK